MGENERTMAEPKCGSRALWGGLMATSWILGLVFVIVRGVMGACTCSSSCDFTSATSLSSLCIPAEMFSGCELSDPSACAASLNAVATSQASGGSATCDKDKCATKGLGMGGFWALIVFAVIFFILGCVFCCGVVPCACFAGPPEASAGGHDAKAATV